MQTGLVWITRRVKIEKVSATSLHSLLRWRIKVLKTNSLTKLATHTPPCSRQRCSAGVSVRSALRKVSDVDRDICLCTTLTPS